MRQTSTYHKPNSRVPFISQLAQEFGRSHGHLWRVITGERLSPLKRRLLRRQAQLIGGALKHAAQTKEGSK